MSDLGHDPSGERARAVLTPQSNPSRNLRPHKNFFLGATMVQMHFPNTMHQLTRLSRDSGCPMSRRWSRMASLSEKYDQLAALRRSATAPLPAQFLPVRPTMIRWPLIIASAVATVPVRPLTSAVAILTACCDPVMCKRLSSSQSLSYATSLSSASCRSRWGRVGERYGRGCVGGHLEERHNKKKKKKSSQSSFCALRKHGRQESSGPEFRLRAPPSAPHAAQRLWLAALT